MRQHFVIALTHLGEVSIPAGAMSERHGRLLTVRWRERTTNEDDVVITQVAVLQALFLGIYTTGGGQDLLVFAVASTDERAKPFFAAQVPAQRVLSLEEAWDVPAARSLLEAAGVKDNGAGKPDRKPHVWAGESPFFDEA